MHSELNQNNENYHTIALMLLVKIIMCNKFHYRNTLNETGVASAGQ
jgi:hypothetical protein